MRGDYVEIKEELNLVPPCSVSPSSLSPPPFFFQFKVAPTKSSHATLPAKLQRFFWGLLHYITVQTFSFQVFSCDFSATYFGMIFSKTTYPEQICRNHRRKGVDSCISLPMFDAVCPHCWQAFCFLKLLLIICIQDIATLVSIVIP